MAPIIMPQVSTTKQQMMTTGTALMIIVNHGVSSIVDGVTWGGAGGVLVVPMSEQNALKHLLLNAIQCQAHDGLVIMQKLHK